MYENSTQDLNDSYIPQESEQQSASKQGNRPPSWPCPEEENAVYVLGYN